MAVRVSFGKRFLLIAGIFILLGIIGFASVHFVSVSKSEPAKPASVSATKPNNFKQPTTFAELVALKPDELGSVDIGLMNLLCAEGLPGAENLNVNECMTTLDQWAQNITLQLDRNFHHYQENPAYFNNSTNFYKMVMMASILSSQFQVHYNPKLIESPTETQLTDDEFFADSPDILIHGLLGSQRMGTCSSMPVLYVALGRRLGYPVKLVRTKGHFFLRWESSTEKFDMEGTQKGMNEYDDEHYKQWPFPVTDEEIKADGYLQSLTPAQELSCFLSTRAACLRAAGKIRDTIAAHAAALRFEPNWRGNRQALDYVEQECFGYSSADLRADSRREFPNHEVEAAYTNAKEIKLKRIEQAELGLPDEVSLPKSIPVTPIN
jgi:regulator of sirC expression with transglutaminase-like and TPR domain